MLLMLRSELRLLGCECVDLLACLLKAAVVLLLQLGTDLVEGEQGGCSIDVSISL